MNTHTHFFHSTSNLICNTHSFFGLILTLTVKWSARKAKIHYLSNKQFCLEHIHPVVKRYVSLRPHQIRFPFPVFGAAKRAWYLFFVDWPCVQLCYRELLGHPCGAVRPPSRVQNKLPAWSASTGRSLRGCLLRDAKFHGLPQQVSLSTALCMQSYSVVCSLVDRSQTIRKYANAHVRLCVCA